MIGSDFKPKTYDHKIHCSECGGAIFAGDVALVSEKNGKVFKIVCSEDCRLEFDARFWAEAAKKNSKRRKATA